jgi:hypothetical protein
MKEFLLKFTEECMESTLNKLIWMNLFINNIVAEKHIIQRFQNTELFPMKLSNHLFVQINNWLE